MGVNGRMAADLPRDRTARLLLTVLPALVAAAVPLLTGMVIAAPRRVDFETRVAAQAAIEQVYWEHRTWPEGNRASKPPFSKTLPEALLRARVDDYLRKSAALEKFWNRPITPAQLQAELARMAANTRSPAVLEEIFQVLGRDPTLIAETLARQSLADRLIRSAYAHDSRLHRAVKMKAQAELAACPAIGCWSSFNGRYEEVTWRLSDDSENRADDSRGVIDLGIEDWKRLLARLPAPGVVSAGSSDPETGALVDTADAFTATAVLERSASAVKTVSVTWLKVPFETWWRSERSTVALESDQSPHAFTLPAIRAAVCGSDTWFPTERVPTARHSHTAVWTGTEMIVWGGVESSIFRTGGRYDPLTDSWRHTSTGAGVPPERYGHTAIWTGAEMIVWGGYNYWPYPINTGGRYDPSIDAWTPTSVGANVPEGRYGHTAVWTGTEMIVWGGFPTSGTLNTGGRYDPSSDTWTPTSTGTNNPTPRASFTAVWTGTEMIVWGGGTNTGGRYQPTTDTWLPTSTAGAPTGRSGHSAVWTGDTMIVWGGGASDVYFGNGGRYDPLTDAWAPMSTGAGVPSPRASHAAVWTGQEMIVWGGMNGSNALNTGSRYDPVHDTWVTMGPSGAPSGRIHDTAIWTGSEMIVWGGDVPGFPGTNTGGRYDPSADTWVATSLGDNVPERRSNHTAVWTGTEMVVWGGAYSNTGGRYIPATDSWTPTSTQGAPAGRGFHTAVWTGNEMIVWGGSPAYVGPPTNSGGRYDPATDSWSPISTGAEVPTARYAHSSVWTGTIMIVWGGYNGSAGGVTNSGGGYDPRTDTWGHTSLMGVPSARWHHTAVWTGSRMIVWGGANGTGSFNTGGNYDPATDTWTPTSTVGAPAPNSVHTAVWTGARMIVWGGNLRAGGRYDPGSDSWTPTSMVNAPSGRQDHTAVWTGAEMIVWGGSFGHSGRRYDPSEDTWTAVSEGANLPAGRSFHSAVWTGSAMIVWGGSPGNAGGRPDFNDGAGYCACPNGHLYYRDADGDGYGDGTVSFPSCDGSVPTGFSSESGDCDDANPSVHPNATELCNDLDDDCDGTTDNAAPPPIMTSLRMHGDAIGLEWEATAMSQSYDVVFGELVTLRSTGGDFALATSGCVTANSGVASAVFEPMPNPGEGFWLIVRGRNCAGPGTYDSGGPAQVGSRDSGISASPLACP
jgi:N-acetylneuraminic acid mutarotase